MSSILRPVTWRRSCSVREPIRRRSRGSRDRTRRGQQILPSTRQVRAFTATVRSDSVRSDPLLQPSEQILPLTLRSDPSLHQISLPPPTPSNRKFRSCTQHVKSDSSLDQSSQILLLDASGQILPSSLQVRSSPPPVREDPFLVPSRPILPFFVSPNPSRVLFLP